MLCFNSSFAGKTAGEPAAVQGPSGSPSTACLAMRALSRISRMRTR